MVQSSELPPGLPDTELNETEDSLRNELPYSEEQVAPALPPILPTASVMETPQNVPCTNHPTSLQSDQTPSDSAFGFQRTDYYLRPRHNRLISFSDNNFELDTKNDAGDSISSQHRKVIKQ